MGDVRCRFPQNSVSMDNFSYTEPIRNQCIFLSSYNVTSSNILVHIVVSFFQNVTQIPPSTEQLSSDPSRDLAAVHDICWAFKSELQQLSQSQVINCFLMCSYTTACISVLWRT